MTAIERTAYPRFKQILSTKDLAKTYTPMPQERLVAYRSTKGHVAKVGFLVLLKAYQRLGRFVPLSEVPSSIIEHIAKPFEPHLHVSDLDTYDTSGTRPRHILLIRALQKLKPYGPKNRAINPNVVDVSHTCANIPARSVQRATHAPPCSPPRIPGSP